MKKLNKQVILCFIIVANSAFAQVDYKFNGISKRCDDAPNGYYTDSGSQCFESMALLEYRQNQPQEQFFKAYNHMDLTEKSVEVKNNNKQYVASEQNNIFVKQGIVKVKDNGAVTYIDEDMLKKFLIEHGVKLSGEYATEETSTKEMINELKEVSNKLTDPILTDNFKSYIIKEKCVDIKDTTQRSICEDNAINELTEREERRGYKIPLIGTEVFSKLTDEEKQEEQKLKTKYEMKNEILASSLNKANMDKYCEGIEDSATRELCESNYVDKLIYYPILTDNFKSYIIKEKCVNIEDTTQRSICEDNAINELTEREERRGYKIPLIGTEVFSKLTDEEKQEEQKLKTKYEMKNEILASSLNKANMDKYCEGIEDSATRELCESDYVDMIVDAATREPCATRELCESDYVEETTEESTTFSSPRTMMRSAAPKRTVVNDLSASQKAQNAMLSSINNNVNRVRYTNNKNLNNSIYNSIKDNVINDSNNAGSINDSMWYSINTDMLSNRDDKTKSSSGSVLLNFGYNFNYIDDIDSSITVSFNQTKSDLKTYSKDIPVNAYNFALSLFNKYNFGNDIVLSSMLSYNHNIVKDGNTKNIQYGYVDGDDYITSNFTKQTNKKHYNDISLSVSALYNKVILDNVKLSSGFDINYFTTNKFHNALTLSPVMELGSVNGMYNNLLFPVVYVKYNTNINNKNININNGSNNKVKLDKSNAEYGVKTKINLPNKLNCVLSYSNDSNRNNNFGANVNINF